MDVDGCFIFIFLFSDPPSFRDRYNSREHPIPFHKATDLGKPPKKLAREAAPDLEEAYVSFRDLFFFWSLSSHLLFPSD